LRELDRFEDALEHLDRARHTFIELGDVGTAAQINDTRARVFIAQQRYVEAEKIAFSSVSTLRGGGRNNLIWQRRWKPRLSHWPAWVRFQSALGILRRRRTSLRRR